MTTRIATRRRNPGRPSTPESTHAKRVTISLRPRVVEHLGALVASEQRGPSALITEAIEFMFERSHHRQ